MRRCIESCFASRLSRSGSAGTSATIGGGYTIHVFPAAWLVRSNLAITNFEGLENLKEVTEALFTRSNQQLESLKGLENLSTVSYFLFRNNDRLPAGTQLLGQTIEQ